MASTNVDIAEISPEPVTEINDTSAPELSTPIASTEPSSSSQPVETQLNEDTNTVLASNETDAAVITPSENTPTPSKKKKLISMKPLKRLSNSFSNLFTSPKPEDTSEGDNNIGGADDRESIVIGNESTLFNTILASVTRGGVTTSSPVVIAKDAIEAATIKCEALKKNLSILSPDEISLANLLLSLQQDHLFKDWEDAGINDDKKHEFFTQVATLNASYPSGLTAYITKARELLEASKSGANPLDGWTPYVPKGIVLDPFTEEYNTLEQTGKSVAALGRVGFVLVAGGLGERLGYNGIKVELPVETTTHVCYLELYCQEILAFQTRYANNTSTSATTSNTATTFELPLAVMVSDDTYSKTLALLKKNQYFGLQRHQVTLMKQEKVAALQSVDASIALLSPYVIDSKPHGHGDVHSLMHSTGTANKWAAQGIQYVAFFQDTNGLSFMSLAAMLGVSVSLDLHVNSLSVPRHAKEAVGGITRLVKEGKKNAVTMVTTGDNAVATEELKSSTEPAAVPSSESIAVPEEMTVNVEYNQLDPLLRSSTNYPQGDVNDKATGLSPFPGNINQLVFKLAPYLATLERTGGHMSEFVNPKYADSSKTKFKKPTRLECMMQDYPKILSREDAAKVGFTMAPAWLCYSPCKNNSADAAVSIASGVPAGSAYTAESDQYNVYAQLLKKLHVNIESAEPVAFNNITAVPGPRVCFHPSFALLPTEIKTRFPKPQQVFISKTSTLVIQGDVVIHSLSLDGALKLTAVAGTRLHVHAGGDGGVVESSSSSSSSTGVATMTTTTAVVHNKGHVMKSLTEQLTEEESAVLTEVDNMRGYKIKVVEEEVINTVSLIDRVTSLSQQQHSFAMNAVTTAMTTSAATTTATTTTENNITTTAESAVDSSTATTTDLAAIITAGTNTHSVSSSQDTDVAAAAAAVTDTGAAVTETTTPKPEQPPQTAPAATTEGDETSIIPPTTTITDTATTSTMSTTAEALATLNDITSALTTQTEQITSSITHAVQDTVTLVVETINSTLTTTAASVGVPGVIEFVYTGKILLPLSAYEPAAATDRNATDVSTTSSTAVGWPCFQLSLGPIKIC